MVESEQLISADELMIKFLTIGLIVSVIIAIIAIVITATSAVLMKCRIIKQ